VSVADRRGAATGQARHPPAAAQRTIASARKRSATNDVATWYALLTEIYRDSVRHNLGWYEADRHLLVMRRGKRVDTLHIGGPFATFTANLSMSDAAQREMFDIWLDEARKQWPAPRTQRGPRRHNSKVSDELFARWRAKKIIEYAYLLIWRARDRRRQAYGKEVIAEWIGRGTGKARRETFDALRDALACLPMLAGQCELELLKAGDKQTRAALARRLSTELARDPREILRRIKKQVP
jgi:hypothetical protein